MATRGPKARSTGSAETFVGRQPELALISRRLDEARAGRGCFMAVSGEPGIGKTRLAQAAVGLAKEKGFRAFWGQCHDGQYIPPYWPWKQLLRDLLRAFPAKGSVNTKATASALSQILSDAGDPASEIASRSPEHVRLRILESVTLLLRILSESGPVLLVIDNLHCADVPSLQLLEVVSREMSGSALAIIGSYREPSAEAGAALRETVGGLAGQEFFESIALSGWDLAGVEECLRLHGAANPPAQLTRAVHERTEGNPLFVQEVARLLQHGGLLEPAPQAAAAAWEMHIPSKVRLAILGLFERLTVPCRDALAAAATIGREFEPSLLREILQQEDTVVQGLLEEALAHGLIEEDRERSGWYRFPHALVQDVVRDQLPGPRRSALHSKIGIALERRYTADIEGHAGQLARHFDAAGPDHTAQAIIYYRQAGERALRLCGYEDAHGQFSRAVALFGDSARPLEAAGLLYGLARAQHGLGMIGEAAATHSSAFALFIDNGDAESAVGIFEQPLILTEKPASLTRVLERAISLVGPGSLRGKALGGKYALSLHDDTGDYLRAASIFEEAVQSARESGDYHQEVSAVINWGRVEANELHFQRAYELEVQGLRMVTDRGEDPWLEGIARSGLTLALLGLGRLEEAERQIALYLKVAARMQTRLWAGFAAGLTFAVQRQKGELGLARETCDRALSLGPVPYRVWNQADRLLLDYETARTGSAAELLQKTIDQADKAEFSFKWEGWLTLLIAWIAWATGEPMPIAAAEEAGRRVPVVGALRGGDAVTVSAGFGLIAVLRGDHESAARHYEEILPFRGLVAAPYLGITADHILAVLACARGDSLQVREHFESALAFCRSSGLALELAYTCRDYAEFLLRGPAKTEAARIIALCREASPIAEQAGAVFLAQRLERARAAVESKPGGREYPDALSTREVDVLRLLSVGLSNAQIGEKLFISLHTVANHVQSILQKTRAANRTEAAAYAIRHHLSPADESDR